LLLEVVSAALHRLADRPLGPGELLAIGRRTTRRHRIVRVVSCPVCGPVVADLPRPPAADRPPPRALRDRPADPSDPTRSAGGERLLAAGALRDRLVDPRFGPVLQIMGEHLRPFAMTAAVTPDSLAAGYGRTMTFGDAEPIAVLEAYERLAGFPHESSMVTGVAYRDVAECAVDPTTLGRYTDEQLAHPTTRVRPSDAQTPMDWAWGFDIDDGRPWLVPADIAFYQYDYRYKRARFRARRGIDGERVHFFHESSSGCALGSNVEEATLHSLFELAERDAFLIAWHKAAPLPRIDRRSVTDPTSRRLLELIGARGYDTYLLVATQDIDVPVVWALAVNRVAPFPACMSSAGTGATGAAAVRAALWELGQLVTEPVTWTRAEVERLAEDPFRMVQLEEHLQLYTLPVLLSRVTRVIGDREVHLDEAFPGWPQRMVEAAGGNVRGALAFVRARFADVGLNRIVVVDQSTRDHRDLGVAAAKAVVPGITPMCFGHAHQRMAALPRLQAAVASVGRAGLPLPYDPHPFP
jgi:ribosomal protein S12 methylthiotransferase accessory factor